MKAVTRFSLGLAVGLLAAAPQARASAPTATTWSVTNFCGGTTFVSCATVTASVSGGLLTMTVTNTGGSYSGQFFGRIGWFNASNGLLAAFTNPCPQATVSCYTPTDGSGGTWSVDNTQNDTKYTGTAPQGATKVGGDGLFIGETITFKFRLTSGSFDLTNAVVAFHVQGGGSGRKDCSSKMCIGYSGSTAQNRDADGNVIPTPTGFEENCGASDTGSPPTEITPEPLSLTLMATGLVGLAGAGFIKRRRKN